MVFAKLAKANRFTFHARRMLLAYSFAGLLPAAFFLAQPLQADDAVHIYNLSTHTTYSNLQTAIDEANTGDTITVSGKIVGNFFINNSLTIKGGDDAVLDGNHSGTVLTIGNLLPKAIVEYIVNIERLTIQHGSGGDGGGVKNFADLTLTHVKVLHNNAAVNGGGVYSDSETATLTLNDTEIAYNSSTYHGAGVYNNAGALFINNSEISHNSTSSGSGGGVANFTGSSVVTITNTEFGHNSAPSGFGGGFYTTGNETTLTNVKFKSNYAEQGGGVFNDGGSLLGINNSKIEKNTAIIGGGLLNHVGIVNFSNSLVEHNHADSTGGGIYNDAGQTINLIKTKVVGNNPNNIVNGGVV